MKMLVGLDTFKQPFFDFLFLDKRVQSAVFFADLGNICLCGDCLCVKLMYSAK